MELDFGPAVRDFRDELRDWLADHLVGEFAEHRGVDVIVEGIEDAEMLEFVRSEVPGTVRALQGYHFGHPSRVPGLASSLPVG
jgi:EAL domain-containing protein (putative c-di-GMP-specific phosphodiesterase class I)